MDLTDKIIAFEDGEMTQEETVEFFSELLKTGILYQLQGSYGRYAAQLIDGGCLDRNGNILEVKE